MKKVVSALAVAAILLPAGFASAIPLFEKDGFKYELSGDLNIWFQQEPGEDQDLDLVFDDFIIYNAVEYDFGNGLTAFGELNFGVNDAANAEGDGVALEDALLGFAYGDYSILFGCTSSATDDFGVVGAVSTPVADDVFDEFGAVDGDDLIRVDATFAEMVTVAAAYEVEADSASSSENGSFFDILASVDVASLTISGAYESLDPKDSEDADAETSDLFGISVFYGGDLFEAGADYSYIDGGENDGNVIYNIYAGMPVNDFTISGGWQMLDYDSDAEEDVSGWYATLTYTFPAHDTVSLFAEIEGTDEDDADMGYLVGMHLEF